MARAATDAVFFFFNLEKDYWRFMCSEILVLNADAHKTFRSADCSSVYWQLQNMNYKDNLSYILSAEDEV